MEKFTEYKNGYSANDHTIRLFWEVFHGLSQPDKKKFLLFLTGSDRIPILGMRAVKVIDKRLILICKKEKTGQRLNHSFFLLYLSDHHSEDSGRRFLPPGGAHLFQSARLACLQYKGKIALQVASSHPANARIRSCMRKLVILFIPSSIHSNSKFYLSTSNVD